MFRVMPIVGVRPQFIKAAPLLRLLDEDDEVELQLVHSGQHYDYEMSKLFFKELGLPDPVENLGVGSGSHAEQTAHILLRVEKVIEKYKPDVVVVFGDANTTLAGALAAVKLHTPVAHVEAGLRSWDMKMPEEVNRVLTDHCSQVLYAPTETAVRNLRREGIPDSKISLSGDTMYDLLLKHMTDIEKSDILKRLSLDGEDYVLMTVHRAENVDVPERLSNIISAVLKLDRLKLVFPIHPRTKNRLKEYKLMKKIKEAKHIIPTDPLGYFDVLKLIKHAKTILTDSGGMQKEALILKTPCITMRDRTEWIETVTLGGNFLVDADEKRILHAAQRVIENPEIKDRLKATPNPYGDGRASEKIIKDLKSRWCSGILDGSTNKF